MPIHVSLAPLAIAAIAAAIFAVAAFRDEPATRRHAAIGVIALLFVTACLAASSLPLWATVTWAAGALAHTVGVIRRAERERANARALPRCSDARIDRVIHEIQQACGFATPIAARIDASATPHSLCAREPIIVIPPDARHWDDWMLRAVLAHEVVHLARHDHLIAWALRLLRALYWFVPGCSAFERSCHRALEESCDDAAARQCASDAAYALALARLAQRNARIAAQHGHHGIARRIERFLRPRDAACRPLFAHCSCSVVILLTIGTLMPTTHSSVPRTSAGSFPLDVVATSAYPRTARHIAMSTGTLEVSPLNGAPNPIYPGSALLAGAQGTVAIDYSVGRDGTPFGAIVRRADDPNLAIAALRAVRATRWVVRADRGGAFARAHLSEVFCFTLPAQRESQH